MVLDQHVEIQRSAQLDQSGHAVGHQARLFVDRELEITAGVNPDAAATEGGGGLQPRAELLGGLAAYGLSRCSEWIVEVDQDEHILHAGVGRAAIQLGEGTRVLVMLAEQEAAVVHALEAEFTRHRGEFEGIAFRETGFAAEGTVKSPLAHREPVARSIGCGAGQPQREGAGGECSGGSGLEKLAAVHFARVLRLGHFRRAPTRALP